MEENNSEQTAADSGAEDEVYKGLRVGIYGPKERKGKGRPGDPEGHRRAALLGWARRRAKGTSGKPAKERSPYGSRFSRGLPDIGTRESRGLAPRVYPGMTPAEKRAKANAYHRQRYAKKKPSQAQLDERARAARARRARKHGRA